MKRQQGLTIVSILFVMMVVGLAVMLVFKLIPVYSEYGEIRKTVSALASEGGKSEYDIRREFTNRAAVGDISSIKADNLVVVSEGGSVFVRATYRREVPLFANVSLVFDFDTRCRQIAPTITP
ncbi:DUF4845 domain-containing protein [Paludibacterium denitrificans]|uniref:DUF4845 domain-containing protein n=1 Tax=Paludibacterium denitrificans TaxID=2675226 RepID=A0A844GH15_9NEIS|nr:DUF4845 domain-containing protein [Paludibacterium denitrificans]MTD33795.1 DUF4845 domain-containing protein [Paludibacterium denitrificans]